MIAAFDALHFLRPQWFWALSALPLLWWAWWDRRKRANVWRGVVDPHLLPHVVEARSGQRGYAGLALHLLAWSLAVLALAGPSWRSGEQPRMQGGLPLVIALDLSSESLAADLPPSRLLQAREKLRTLLASRTDGDVGLIAYADDAFTVAPMTSDADNVALFLDALSPEIMPVDGRRADRAIDAAVALLRQAGHERGTILLLAGQADAAARNAAADAAAEGFRVSVIGLGTTAGAAFRDRDGNIRQTRLDATALQALAQAGGGRFVAMATDASDIESIVGTPVPMPASRASGVNGERVALDDGHWLLLPLMLLAMFAFRRGAALASLLVCMLLPWQVQAQEGGLWQRADQAEHARLRAGTEAYRRERYDEAAMLWRGLPGAEAAYNAGNALARSGRLEEAIKSYDEALRIAPEMEDAVANRAAVAAALKRKPPPGANDRAKDGESEQQRDGDRQPADDASSAARPGEDGEQRDGPAGDEQQDASRQNAADGANRGEHEGVTEDKPQVNPTDVQAQREADDMQRQRMQQALAQGERQAVDGEPVDVPQDIEDTVEERERRQAGEAWLRRIPDDPGALLRMKFRLEHERRNGTRGTR